MRMKIYLVGCKVNVRLGLGIKQSKGIIKTQAEDGHHPVPGTLSQELLTQCSFNKGASHKHRVSASCL